MQKECGRKPYLIALDTMDFSRFLSSALRNPPAWFLLFLYVFVSGCVYQIEPTTLSFSVRVKLSIVLYRMDGCLLKRPGVSEHEQRSIYL